mgnify:CR=1 FL=1
MSFKGFSKSTTNCMWLYKWREVQNTNYIIHVQQIIQNFKLKFLIWNSRFPFIIIFFSFIFLFLFSFAISPTQCLKVSLINKNEDGVETGKLSPSTNGWRRRGWNLISLRTRGDSIYSLLHIITVLGWLVLFITQLENEVTKKFLPNDNSSWNNLPSTWFDVRRNIIPSKPTLFSRVPESSMRDDMLRDFGRK